MKSFTNPVGPGWRQPAGRVRDVDKGARQVREKVAPDDVDGRIGKAADEAEKRNDRACSVRRARG